VKKWNGYFAGFVSLIVIIIVVLVYINYNLSHKENTVSALNVKQQISNLEKKTKATKSITSDDLLNLGRYYQMEKQYDKALQVYKEATAKYKNNRLAWHNLANVYTHKGDFKDAIIARQKVVKLDPSGTDYYYLSQDLLVTNSQSAYTNAKQALSLTKKSDSSYKFYSNYVEAITNVNSDRNFDSYINLIGNEGITFPEIKLALIENMRTKMKLTNNQEEQLSKLEKEINNEI
jgi:tetratricopeptide (TPR) repeat protein